MSCYRTCPLCGSSLVPGELCDCQKESAAPGVTSTRDGKAEQIDKAVSASIITQNSDDCKEEIYRC